MVWVWQAGGGMRPVLRYHGGKWKLAPWIISHFPSHRVYVEPYGGGASVLMRKPRCYAEVYNDLDGEVVNLFRVIRERSEEFRRAVELTPFSREEFKESFEVSDDPVEQARRTVARSLMGFGSNALCRAIKTGFRPDSNRSGTTPAHDWRNYPESIPEMVERLRGVVIENKDALEVIRRHHGPETLFYCDPPYVWETRSAHRVGGKGYSHEMTEKDHRNMAETLHGIEGKVVVSGYGCPLYDEELFPEWFRVERRTMADGARERVEVLWINPAAAAELDFFGVPAGLVEVAEV